MTKQGLGQATLFDSRPLALHPIRFGPLPENRHIYEKGYRFVQLGFWWHQ
jgi:hypothetical protein